ncbi:NAD kinase 2, mitochondrial-like [Amphiura filiformis]|uniref:NAD kinase 2, mitochondrial-like n=1 Tax=Amphiura filiformis TaxID=82378 RepID=UPI003B219146
MALSRLFLSKLSGANTTFINQQRIWCSLNFKAANDCGNFARTRLICTSSVYLLESKHRGHDHHAIRKYGSEPISFNPKRAVVVSKMSRFEFEKRRYTDHQKDHREVTEKKLRKVLAMRGSDYDRLMGIHEIHLRNLHMIVSTLEKYGIEVDIVQRQDYTTAQIQEADMIVSAGGDGTFLMAASKVLDDKPVLGVNTDTHRSEGYLCLPNKYSTLDGFDAAVKMITTGKFKWKWRQRIRATIECGIINMVPIDLHEEELSFPDHRDRHIYQQDTLINSYGDIDTGPRVLPVRALNEVFMGESLSSRASYYEISIDGGPMEKQKNSGITVCTGTGSTSWTYNINKLPPQSVQEIMRIIQKETGTDIPVSEEIVQNIAQEFNDRVIFDASEPSMVYTIRDPIINGIYQQIWLPRGYARRIIVRSRCFDACLVMDGGSSFIFNDGAIATLETKPEDALRTFELDT